MAKKMANVIVPLKEQGIDNLVGTGQSGLSVQYLRITATGTPFAITFAGQGLKDMENVDYGIYVNGPNGDERGDPSTYTTVGFSVINTGNGEVLRIMIVGRTKGQAA